MRHTDQDTVTTLLGDSPALLTPAEAAQAVRRSTRTIRRWIGAGILRAMRPAGGRPLIARAELLRLLREGAQ